MRIGQPILTNHQPPATLAARQRPSQRPAAMVSDTVQMQINSLNKATWAAANEDARNLANQMNRIRAKIEFVQPQPPVEEIVEDIEEVEKTIAQLIKAGLLDPEDEFTAAYIQSLINELLDSAEFITLREEFVNAAMRLGLGLGVDTDLDEILLAVATHMVKHNLTIADVFDRFQIEGVPDDLQEALAAVFAEEEETATRVFHGLNTPEHVLEYMKQAGEVIAATQENERLSGLLTRMDDIRTNLY